MTETNTGLQERLQWIQESLPFFIPELIVSVGIVVVLITGLALQHKKVHTAATVYILSLIVLIASTCVHITSWGLYHTPVTLFGNMLQKDSLAVYLILLFDIGGIFTIIMSFQKNIIARRHTEYACLLLAVVLGAHLLAMSKNFVMVFLSLELISISSYVLTGFAFRKESTEGSLKYFLFGAVASAVMLYGFSVLYGLTGTPDFTSPAFGRQLLQHQSALLLLAGLFSLAGFLFKIAAIPMHPWAPDVYEVAPMPVVAFFSVVPKLAGIGILARFLLSFSRHAGAYDWQLILGVVAMLTITVGNFSALKQKSPKRMMAYSSIAQSGFLLIGITAFLPQGLQFMLFYAAAYLLANFLVFACLQVAEKQNVFSMADFAGTGKSLLWWQVFMVAGFISLTGLPPTAGFTAKLFVFSSLWDAYGTTGKPFLLWLLVLGLLNTVVSLFYYLRIPFFAFFKRGRFTPPHKGGIENFFGLILVVLILILFFQPNILVRWINTINFVL